MLLLKRNLFLASLCFFSSISSAAAQIYRDGDRWRQDSYYLHITWADIPELNDTYIGYGASHDALQSLVWNNTADTANFSVGLFANSMHAPPEARDQFFFTYYSSYWDPKPQQWSVSYCLTNMRLTLVGRIPGILDLHSNFFPTSWKIPPGVPMEWDTFVSDKDGFVKIDDGSTNPYRQWIAYKFDNDKDDKDTLWNIGLHDGVTLLPQRAYAIAIQMEWTNFTYDRRCWP